MDPTTEAGRSSAPDEPPQGSEPNVSSESTAVELLKEQIVQLRAENQALASERDEFRDALQTIGDERDELSQQIASPDAQANRIKELEGVIRTGKHRDAFRGLASKSVREEALADLFDLMRSKPGEFGLDPKDFDADEPDAKRYEAALAKARETRGYAFIPDAEQAAGGEPSGPTWPDSSRFKPTQTPPVVGGGRGSSNRGQDATIITAEQRMDPAFMLNPRNQEAIYLAAREGRIR